MPSLEGNFRKLSDPTEFVDAPSKGIKLSCLPFRLQENHLAWLSMVMLIFQGTALSLTLRCSRTLGEPGQQYLASVAVIYTELAKLAICLVAQTLTTAREAAARGAPLGRELQKEAGEVLSSSTPMLVPAGLFVMQQVLVIVAASHLDAVTFQICSQSFKIMPTALLAVWLLGQQLTIMQWGSLPLLAVGVCLVTVNGSAGKVEESHAHAGDWALGMAASALSGLSSAYAGVYFEKYVKGRHAGTLWVRNLQLGLYGVPLSIVWMWVKDGLAVRAGGLMQGFGYMAWGVVALQVFGGLIVGMVVKYADNILKNFANALSVIFTVLFAIPLFGQVPSIFFLVGITLVLGSVFMYAQPDPKALQSYAALFRSGMLRGLLEPRGGHGEREGPLIVHRRVRSVDRWDRRSGLGLCLALAGITAAVFGLLAAATLHAPLRQALAEGMRAFSDYQSSVLMPGVPDLSGGAEMRMHPRERLAEQKQLFERGSPLGLGANASRAVSWERYL